MPRPERCGARREN